MSQTPFPSASPQGSFPTKPGVGAGETSGGGGGRACGCFVIGCGGFMALMIGMCGFGYYLLSYTATPLRLMEQQLESSGEVRIEGLEGNLTSGFRMESLEVRAEPLRDATSAAEAGEVSEDNGALPDEIEPAWNRFSDLRLEYSGVSIFGSNLVLKDLSVGSARIYTEFADSPSAGEFLPFDVMWEVNREMQDELGELTMRGGGGLYIENVSLRDFTFVDRRHQSEFKIEEIRFQNLRLDNGGLTDIGDLAIRTDSLELLSGPSPLFPNNARARQYAGRVKAAAGDWALRDIPFAIDLQVSPQAAVEYRASGFDGQLEIRSAQAENGTEMAFNQFDYESFIKPRIPCVVPSRIEMKLTLEKSRSRSPATIAPGSSWRLGQTVFTNFEIQTHVQAERSNTIAAVAQVGGREIQAVGTLSRRLPLWEVELFDTADPSATQTEEGIRELWALVAYGTSWAELSPEDSGKVREAASRQWERRPLAETADAAPEKPASEQGGEPSADSKSGDEAQDENREPPAAEGAESGSDQ